MLTRRGFLGRALAVVGAWLCLPRSVKAANTYVKVVQHCHYIETGLFNNQRTHYGSMIVESKPGTTTWPTVWSVMDAELRAYLVVPAQEGWRVAYQDYAYKDGSTTFDKDGRATARLEFRYSVLHRRAI